MCTNGMVAAVCGGAALERQVAEWSDTMAIDACMDYRMGPKEDGTLVFAGQYTFYVSWKGLKTR